MRTPTRRALELSVATFAVAAVVSACSDARATTDADLQRDLALASSTVSLAGPVVDSANLTSLETRPKAAPEKASVLKKADGPRAVSSRTPTVRATPVDELAATEESEEEVVEVMAEAPAPEESSEPVAVAPRPQPVVVDAGGAGDYGTGSGGVYGGGGGVWGTGGGIIIRGGGIDGDNCVPRGRGGVYSGPVFVPRTPAPTTGGTVVNLPRPTGGGMRGGSIGGSRTRTSGSVATTRGGSAGRAGPRGR